MSGKEWKSVRQRPGKLEFLNVFDSFTVPSYYPMIFPDINAIVFAPMMKKIKKHIAFKTQKICVIMRLLLGVSLRKPIAYPI